MDIYLVLALTTLVVSVIIGVQWYKGINSISFLKDTKIDLDTHPFVSIVVAACNEEETVERSIESIMKLEYKNFELIVVNDRSKDKTGDIIEKLQSKYSNLRVIHIKSLPEGWLGKNNALYEGSKISKGEWLLFTDADIIFSKDCLGKALTYISKNGLDHLCLLFQIIGGSLPYRIYFTYWSIGIIWLITTQKHVGVGAFNLIKKSVYKQIGTHKAIALRPDDDLKLGKMVVIKGFKQGVLFGNDLIRVKWYGNLREIIRGFEKNAFAVLDYNLFLVLSTSILTTFFHLYPIIGIFLGDITSKFLNLLSLLIVFLMYKHSSKYVGNPLWFFLANPISAVVNNYILLRATIKNLIEGKITWRGTDYPLDILRKNKI